MNSSNFRQQLYHPKTNKFGLFASLKLDSTIEGFIKVINASLSHPITKAIIYSNPLPKEYNEIRKSRLVQPTSNLEGEIAWNLYAISNYTQTINDFILLKLEFENSILLNEFEKAEFLLNKIEKEICKSVWSIENRFLLKELKYGSDANWTELSDVSKIVSDWLLLFLVEQFSKRAESKISYLRYKDLFSSQIETIPYERLAEYFCFRLNYLGYTGFTNFPFFLAIESNSSIIDRYLTLIDVISEIVITQKKDALDKSIIKTLVHLSSIIQDSRVEQLLALTDPSLYRIQEKSDHFLRLIDYFTKGEYNRSIELAKEMLPVYPSSIEIYEIYIKSYIESGLNFQSTGISEIIDQTLQKLNHIFRHSENLYNSSTELYKSALAMYSSSWGKQLYCLVAQQTSKKFEQKLNKLHFINSGFNNPRILDSEEIKTLSDSTLVGFFNSSFPSNKGVKVNTSILLGDITALNDDTEIIFPRKHLYILRALKKAERFSELKEHCLEFLKSDSLPPSTIEEIIYHLFYSYFNLKDFKEALVLYVQNSVLEKSLVQRIDEQELLQIFTKLDQSNLFSLIDLPIFFNLSSNDTYEQYVAYDNFMVANNLEKPSDIFLVRDSFDETKYIYFLKEVCNIEVLHYSLYFNCLDDIENERLDILRALLQIDRKNEAEYVKEIAELTQNVNIRKAIREVNKGKITVNVAQLKNIESSNVKEGFTRYQELVKYSKNNKDAIGVDFTTKQIEEYIKNLFEERAQKQEGIKTDPAYISFKAMFLDLRDKYLMSKEYGLDGYLSTRIRHGTLENYIRSVFENLHLLSEKDTNGKYLPISYWDDKFPPAIESQKILIQDRLVDFSKRIDDTIHFIIKEQIQVYTEKHNSKPNAFFNYRYTEEFLWLNFNVLQDSVKEYNGFLDYCFRTLEDTTINHLEKIRDHINGELMNMFVGQINDLHDQISKILSDNSFIDLTSAINRSRTEIQNELRNISEWFNLSNPSKDIILDLDTIIKTSVEITNSIYPNHKINADYKNKTEMKILGNINLIYISRILLDNIIKHSLMDTRELPVEIALELLGFDTLRLLYSNPLSDRIDKEKLKITLNEKRNRWLSEDSYEKINLEGGSGFDKIRKILAFDMKCKHFGFDYIIDSDKLTILLDIDITIREDETE